MIERIHHAGREMAVIVRRGFSTDGIEFFTPPSYSQQLGYMKRPAGYVVAPHVHRPIPRQVQMTNEVLFIRSGSVRIDFYCADQRLLESRTLLAGDIILLAECGHGLEMLEPCEILEVKQGPYAGHDDKTPFMPREPS